MERVRPSRDLVNREPLRTCCLPSYFGPVKPSSKGLRSTVAIPLRQSGGGRALSPGHLGFQPSCRAFPACLRLPRSSLLSTPPLPTTSDKPPRGLLPIMPLHEARGDRRNSEGSEVKAWLWQHPRGCANFAELSADFLKSELTTQIGVLGICQLFLP